MSQAIGLIDIDIDGTAGCAESSATFDDATLDGLFNRLIAPDFLESDERPLRGEIGRRSSVVSANLDALRDDLDSAARQILTSIFLGFGQR